MCLVWTVEQLIQLMGSLVDADFTSYIGVAVYIKLWGPQEIMFICSLKDLKVSVNINTEKCLG